MLTVEQFHDLEVGDRVNTSPIFPALSQDDPTVLIVDTKTETRAEFVATYFGVTLGRWACDLIHGDKLQWSF